MYGGNGGEKISNGARQSELNPWFYSNAQIGMHHFLETQADVSSSFELHSIHESPPT